MWGDWAAVDERGGGAAQGSGAALAAHPISEISQLRRLSALRLAARPEASASASCSTPSTAAAAVTAASPPHMPSKPSRRDSGERPPQRWRWAGVAKSPTRLSARARGPCSGSARAAPRAAAARDTSAEGSWARRRSAGSGASSSQRAPWTRQRESEPTWQARRAPATAEQKATNPRSGSSGSASGRAAEMRRVARPSPPSGRRRRTAQASGQSASTTTAAQERLGQAARRRRAEGSSRMRSWGWEEVEAPAVRVRRLRVRPSEASLSRTLSQSYSPVSGERLRERSCPAALRHSPTTTPCVRRSCRAPEKSLRSAQSSGSARAVAQRLQTRPLRALSARDRRRRMETRRALGSVSKGHEQPGAPWPCGRYDRTQMGQAAGATPIWSGRGTRVCCASGHSRALNPEPPGLRCMRRREWPGG